MSASPLLSLARPFGAGHRMVAFCVCTLLLAAAGTLLALVGAPCAAHARQRPTQIASPVTSRQGVRVARGFLAGYLRYTTGRRITLADASPAVQQELKLDAPPVSPAQRRRIPQIARLREVAVGGRQASVRALIDDGESVQWVLLIRLAAVGRRLLVTGVQEGR